MIALVITILTSSLTFVIFKFYGKFKVNTFHAVVFNYVTASSCGFIMYHQDWTSEITKDFSWLPITLTIGALFISMFMITGISSLKNGVGKTSIAGKMSMALSMTMMYFFYNEEMNIYKILGIVLAFVGVILVSQDKTQSAGNRKYVWLLLLLFIGSGMLDFLLNYSLKNLLGPLSPALFTTLGFTVAGTIGMLILLIRLSMKGTKLQLRSIIGGIVLGVPNFFSIYFLLRSYETAGWSDITVLSVMNIGVVLLSTILGLIIFKESMHKMKTLGLISAILAIALLYVANL